MPENTVFIGFLCTCDEIYRQLGSSDVGAGLAGSSRL